jgi:hypothetical protein
MKYATTDSTLIVLTTVELIFLKNSFVIKQLSLHDLTRLKFTSGEDLLLLVCRNDQNIELEVEGR